MAQFDNEGASLRAAISEILKRRVAEAQEDVIRKTVGEFEQRLRREVATAAMEVSNFYDLYRDDANLVITVKHQNTK